MSALLKSIFNEMCESSIPVRSSPMSLEEPAQYQREFDAIDDEKPSPLLLDYLETMLREGTESALVGSVLIDNELNDEKRVSGLRQSGIALPERDLASFDCLRFVFAGHCLLTPLSRIKRIDERLSFDDNFGLAIPEGSGEATHVMRLQHKSLNIFIQQVIDIYHVDQQSIIWHKDRRRHPWYVGTHKSLLCSIFDPNLLIEQMADPISA